MVRFSALLSVGLCSVVGLLATPALAEPPATLAGSLPQIGRVPVLDGRVRWLTFAASAGYGFVEELDETGTAQHRVPFRAGVGTAPLPWLSASLDFEGGYAVTGDDDSFVLDPRLRVRGALPLDGPLRVGLDAALWVPPSDESALVFEATTLDLVALVTVESGAWTFAGHAGYRFDGSGRAVTDRDQLSAADRVALRASDHDSVLVGIGGTLRLDSVTLGAEATWEPAVGEGSPDASAWPLRLTPMARFSVAREPAVEVFVLFDALLTGRAPLDTMHLSPFDPRVRVELGLFFALEPPAPLVEAEAPPDERPPPDPQPEEAAPPEPAPPAPVVEPPVTEPVAPVGRVEGRVRGRGGAQVRATVRVEPAEQPAEGSEAPEPVEASVAADGSFGVDVPPGAYRVVVEAPGFRTQRLRVTVGDREAVDLHVDLFPQR